MQSAKLKADKAIYKRYEEESLLSTQKERRD